jgi:hypothetical protein
MIAGLHHSCAWRGVADRGLKKQTRYFWIVLTPVVDWSQHKPAFTRFIGSLIGFAYAFVCGFVAGHFVTRINNWLLDIKEGNRGILPPPPRRK